MKHSVQAFFTEQKQFNLENVTADSIYPGPVPHSVAVSLSPTCVELLAPDGAGDEENLNRRLVAAVAYFLTEDLGEAGHSYPEFHREESHGARREFKLVIAADRWRRFVAEADRQRVSPERLLEHAAFYFVAEADAGRVAERIAEDLRDGP
jgi:hypothetical protein